MKMPSGRPRRDALGLAYAWTGAACAGPPGPWVAGALHAQPVAVIFDLVDPLGAGRDRLAGVGRQKSNATRMGRTTDVQP